MAEREITLDIQKLPAIGLEAPASSALLSMHAALEFEDVWPSLQELLESVVVHDTMVMSMNYLDWRREATLSRLTSGHSRVSTDATEGLNIAEEGRNFFQPFIESNRGLSCYRHSQIIANQQEIVDTSYYKRCMLPLGWRYSAHMLIWRGNGIETSIALRRRADQGDFSDNEMGLLEALHPHIAVALQRVWAYERERQRRRLLESHYLRSPESVLFLDWDNRLLYASEEAVAASCLWNLGPEAARCYSPRKVMEVPQAILTACETLREKWMAQETGSDGSRASLTLAVEKPKTQQIALLTLRHNGNGELARPVFVVRITRKIVPNDTNQLSPEKLRYLLTVAERELVDLVCDGMSNREIADRVCKTEGSVKVQLSGIYQKLGVKSRTQLVLALRQQN